MLNLKITLKRCKSQLPTFETILPQFLVNIIKPLAYHRPIDITTPHIIWSTFGSYDIKLNQWSTDRLDFEISTQSKFYEFFYLDRFRADFLEKWNHWKYDIRPKDTKMLAISPILYMTCVTF